ncbi:MAG: YncE family protein [Flavobacterium sp.]
MKITRLALSLFALSIVAASCSDDDTPVAPAPSGAYADGVLILNQGGFGHGDASVSFLTNDFELENNIFAGVNPDILLGDTAQDMGLVGDRAYIVLNNSHKIEVVNRYTFDHIATIEDGLDNPRYIAFANGKGFVTNWGDPADTTDDYVAVIDLASNTVTAEKAVAEGPERIIENNGKLYVAHKGGYGYGNKVTVINGTTNAVETTLPVGYVPEGLVVENGRLYVLSGGVPSWSWTLPESAGSLTIINLSDNTVASTINFSAMAHPMNLQIEDGSVYYTEDSSVYKMSLTATAFPTTPLFTTTAQGEYGVYSFAVEDGHIFLGDAGDYNSAGKVYVHSLTGANEHTYTVGVVPTGFYFN